MKKNDLAVFAIACFAFFQSCGSGSKKNASDTGQKNKALSATAKATTPACPNCSTLDGVDQTTAVQQIANFYAFKDKDNNTQKAASVSFNVDQLRQIDSLLTSEFLTLPAGKQPDGVRFYFGCDSPRAGTNKLNVLIHIVSTRTQDTTGHPEKSTHADYYDHNAAFLKKPFGNQDNSTTPLNPGLGRVTSGTVYQDPGTTTPCVSEPGNYVDEHTAYTWAVKNRLTLPDPINTVSDWFRLCFIQYLFRTIYNNPQIFNGLRVYLVLGKHKEYPNNRDIVLLVPINKEGKDYPDCIGKIPNRPPVCDSTTDLWFKSLKEYFKDKENWAKLNPEKRNQIKNYIRFPFFYSRDVSGGGYDNGELCPTHCP